MSQISIYDSAFLGQNFAQAKNLALVVSIPGVDLLTNRTIFSGGVAVANQRSLMSNDSSLTIAQRLEPEQGRASVSTLSLTFIDKDSYMTQVLSPGVLITEILGSSVQVSVGYTENSYPNDYAVIFHGKITAATYNNGKVTLQISDPNVSRRQDIFYTEQATLSGDITSGGTTITLSKIGDFHQMIQNISGAYDPAIKLYMKIDNEFIEYGPSATVPTGTIVGAVFSNVVRGARGTTASAHTSGSTVTAAIQISDNPISMALKIMFSKNGNYLTNQSLFGIVQTNDGVLGNQTGAFILPAGIDAIRDLGLTAGDKWTISGAANGANNTSGTIVKFGPIATDTNRVVYTSVNTLVVETPTNGKLAVRSQYDSYPITCGVGLAGADVDVAQHQYIYNTFFAGSASIYNLRFLIQEKSSAKTFIENEVYLPFALYSLTRVGRLSVGLTKPPIADQNLQVLSVNNIVSPNTITVSRATNNRKFFNEIDYTYDLADDNSNFATKNIFFDTASNSLIGINSVIPITSKGARSDLNYDQVIAKQGQFLLSRYSRGATIIDLAVQFGVGCQIEAGDVVAIQDNGQLQIPNFATGVRNIGTILMEVVNRSLDLKQGVCRLTLISGVGASILDRYATIAPSSTVVSATATSITISDSYGAIFPGNEPGKWSSYIGLPIQVHDLNWGTVIDTTLLGFDPTNQYKMLVSAMSSTPSAGYIVDIPPYPTSTDSTLNQTYKVLHCSLDPSPLVTAGVSSVKFTVGVGDIAKFAVGQYIRVHDSTYAFDSGEVVVQAVDNVGNNVTVSSTMGGTPAAGYIVDLIGFADGGQPYRWI